MSRSHRPSVTLLGGLLFAAVACNLGGNGEQADPDQVATAVAETLEFQDTQTAEAAPPTDDPSAATSTPELIESPTVTLTPTEASTLTPAVPMVSVSTNTNCRIGPGIVYDYRGALLVGETAEVVARSSAGNYWYIVNPDLPGEFCYLWGEYATVAGDTAVLPAFTPPPSPTPTNTSTPTPTASYTPTP